MVEKIEKPKVKDRGPSMPSVAGLQAAPELSPSRATWAPPIPEARNPQEIMFIPLEAEETSTSKPKKNTSTRQMTCDFFIANLRDSLPAADSKLLRCPVGG